MSGAFLSVAREHRARYPAMEPQDFGKLAYQNEFGPAHLLQSPEQVLAALSEEQKEANASPPPPEPVGNGLCRFHIAPDLPLPLLGRLFASTAAAYRGRGSLESLRAKLECLRALDIPGWEAWLADYLARGCPPVRHSPAFRTAYHPHYRLLSVPCAGFFPALAELEALSRSGRPAVAAIDGRCGSGKTGLASLAEQVIFCQVVHMDHFYLPPERRAPNWMDVPAGNMDLARLREEVLLPAREGRLKAYRPYDCKAGCLEEAQALGGHPLTVVEGTYSQHPSLAAFYRCKLFLTCKREEQTRRLQAREGDGFPAFDRIWRAMEERYFAACGTEAAAGLCVDTTGFFR